ncbi:MAG: AAA family ATPase [Planctomycetes bacterium]|nr:AAA family ATPase [Planctomycetota bacterium]
MTALPRTVRAASVRAGLERNLGAVVAAPEAVIEPILCTLVAGGHLLLDGIPGIGKTLLARTIAQSVAGEFRRIQFTNDVMPGDVTGSAVWRPDLGRFAFVRGPLFANVVLADEINRTSPRTLSCLLEAMESGAVSVEGRTLELGRPFLVLATRNPAEFAGTFAVPEAALDRFLVRIGLDYPDAAAELALYAGQDAEARLATIRPVVDCDQLLALRAEVEAVQVRPAVAEYAYRLVQATRAHPELRLGASPRAALAWLRAAKGRAALDGRGYVLPDDLKALALPALAHRVFRRDGATAAPLLGDLVGATPVPL